jgi:hypothetical protein
VKLIKKFPCPEDIKIIKLLIKCGQKLPAPNCKIVFVELKSKLRTNFNSIYGCYNLPVIEKTLNLAQVEECLMGDNTETIF